jgi:hypothetical protein
MGDLKDSRNTKRIKSEYSMFLPEWIEEISRIGILSIAGLCLRDPDLAGDYIYELWRNNRLEDIYDIFLSVVPIQRDAVVSTGAVLIIGGGFSQEQTTEFFYDVASTSLKATEGLDLEDSLPESELPLLKFEIQSMVNDAEEIASKD